MGTAEWRFGQLLANLQHAGPAENDGPLSINKVSADASGAGTLKIVQAFVAPFFCLSFGLSLSSVVAQCCSRFQSSDVFVDRVGLFCSL